MTSNHLRAAGAAACLALASTAWAQSNVQIYGQIDQGVEVLHGASGNGDQTLTRVSNALISPHFGFRGTEDLGGGLKVSFNLESSFTPDNGTLGLGGRLWGRQANVELSGDFGALRLGRQFTMVKYGWDDANPFGTGNHGLRLLDPRIVNPRADNAVTYLFKARGFSGGVTYSTGWDSVNGNPAAVAAANCPGESTDSRQCRAWSWGLKYDGARWGIGASDERLYGGTTATFGGLSSPDKTDSRFVLGGYVLAGDDTKLTAGWTRRDNKGIATPVSNMVWLQGQSLLHWHAFHVDALAAQLKYEDSPNKAMVLNARVRYVLSKRTELYSSAAHIDNDGALDLAATGSTPAVKPLPGHSQYSIITGIRHTF